jgi:hypothetical protein
MNRARKLAALFSNCRSKAIAARLRSQNFRQHGDRARTRTAELEAQAWEHLAAQVRDRLIHQTAP